MATGACGLSGVSAPKHAVAVNEQKVGNVTTLPQCSVEEFALGTSCKVKYVTISHVQVRTPPIICFEIFFFWGGGVSYYSGIQDGF